MHSIDEYGRVCVNLNDYQNLTDSIKFRDKIAYLTDYLKCPKEISNFSIAIIFRDGQRYYISNLYLWAITYRTEGLDRGDIDHSYTVFDGKEFFVQSDIQYDAIQSIIIHLLETRYKLSTIFAMVRQCIECDFIIEVYNKNRVPNPKKIYYQIREQLEEFICQFFDAMQQEIASTLSSKRWLAVISNNKYRKQVLTRQLATTKLPPLTVKERQCLSLLSQGFKTPEVAAQMYL